MYYVNVMDLCMDTVSDSIHVTVFPLPEVDIGNDSAILCDGDTLLLNAGSGYLAYLWQDTSTDSTFIVTEPGLYYVIVSGPGGCTTSDSVFVELTEMAIELGVDTTICIGDTITFYAGEGFSSYLWQDGSTNSTYTAYETGWYWVDVVLDGCSVTDSVYLYVDDPDVSVELGDDIIICSGDVIVLQPQSGVFNSYTWSTGDTTSSIMVSLPGTYILEVEGGCGESSDTITIGNYPPVNINLGPDLTLCFGESEMLNPSGFNSYLWQDNSTQPFFIVNQSGMYYVDVTDNHGCIGSDTVYAQVGSIVDLGPDTILCEGKTITLDAGYEFDFYNWNTGQSGVQSIEVTEGGTYSVEVNYYFGCTSEDEIYIEGVPLPVAVISGNDNLCEGETIWLNALPGSYEYYWNGNTTPDSASIEVTQGGTYVLRTENVCGDTTTEKTIQEYPLPEPNLGDDLTLFPGDYINLNPGQFNSYLWQDNSENPTYPVSYEDLAVEDSIFFVEVFDGFCFNKDEIIIRIFNVEVPNVITPNGDNKNDIFKPINFVGVNNHNIMIFNRWGNKVWESNNFNDGWDGKENGKYVAEGTYFWVLEVYYGTDNVKKAYKGSVTVLGTGGS
ncbi:MAG: hypothetical protein B6D61_10590 [Bacteroidetes bacterium 4484_249]|nr:MAG: hypothetical protein B6D61_10590 [Bacteroidetes bacterium 4484_249]